MNPIAFDFMLIAPVVFFSILPFLICGIIIFVFVRRKQKQHNEIVAKLNSIVDLLENDKTK